MPRFTARERRERYLREFEFQKRTGKQFFPYAILHDAIMSLIVVGLIIGLSVLWYVQADPVPEGPNAGRSGGILGSLYESRADPAIEGYDPKPEWYFFFLFELLRIFKTPELLLFGTIIVPTILMMLLLALPFIDRRPERRLSRRPIAMGTAVLVPVALMALTWYGSKAPGAAGEASSNPGATAFASDAGCGSCHTMADAGTNGNVGPNLDNAKPSYEEALTVITNGRGGMPAFKGQLDENQIKCLAGYISTYSGATEGGQEGGGAAGGETPGGAGDDYTNACQAAGGNYSSATGEAGQG
jgi:mono/diheme cytochrome c family protein